MPGESQNNTKGKYKKNILAVVFLLGILVGLPAWLVLSTNTENLRYDRPSPGEKIVLERDILLHGSKESFERAVRCTNSGDLECLDEMRKYNEILFVPAGTTVKINQIDLLMAEIIVLEGVTYETIGWVPFEDISIERN